MTVTVSQLYGLYCAGHAQARALAGPDAPLAVDGARTTSLEHLILELALLDATNGTPARSLRAFERALAQGADLLAALGLEVEPLDEAA